MQTTDETQAELQEGDEVLVKPDKKNAIIIKVLPGNGIRPTEYHVKGRGSTVLSRNYWRAEHLKKVGHQERLDV